MRQQLGMALTHTWEDLASRGIRQTTFYKSNRAVVCAFMEEADIDALVKAGENSESVPKQVKRVVESSHIGKSMYREGWLQVSRYLYQQDIEATLKDLEHLDFDEAEVVSFKGLMVRGLSS